MQSRDAINKIERQLNYECFKKGKRKKRILFGTRGGGD